MVSTRRASTHPAKNRQRPGDDHRRVKKSTQLCPSSVLIILIYLFRTDTGVMYLVSTNWFHGSKFPILGNTANILLHYMFRVKLHEIPVL